MFFSVELTSPKPVYQQLIDQIKLAVATGRLKPGDRLPAIRDAAVELRINRNTVARVYSELEREGILYNRAGQGSFVSDRVSSLSRAEQRRQLVARLDELLAQANLFGYSRQQIADLMAQRLGAIYPPEEEK